MTLEVTNFHGHFHKWYNQWKDLCQGTTLAICLEGSREAGDQGQRSRAEKTQ